MSLFLNVNDLLSAEGCDIGDYRIDWHLNSTDGAIVFMSGNVGNTDPELDAFHPLVDEIVVGGLLYPVIRYVYVGGDKYASISESGSRYSPDLIDCLDPIFVESITCGSELNPSSDYPYRLIREVNVGEKNRSIKFDLVDGIDYVAWAFTALQIDDRLNIYYCKGNDPDGEIIDSFVVGANIISNYNPTNYPRQTGYNPALPVTPIYVQTSSAVKYISDMRPFTYELGDWLRFEVLGNISSPSEDETKWTLEIKCFETLDLSNNFADIGKFDEPTFAVEWDAANCRTEIRYSRLDNLSSVNNDVNIFLRKYMSFGGISLLTTNVGGVSAAVLSAGSTEYRFPKSTTLTNTAFGNINGSLSTCAALAGTINIEKTSTHLNLSFTHSDDYNLVVTNINAVQANARYTAFLASSPTDVQYYGYYDFQFRLAESCDLPSTTKVFRIHLSSVITYDNPNSISFSLVEVSNGYTDPEEDCNSIMGTINSWVNLINTTKNEANDTYSTNVRFAGSGTTYGLIPRAYGANNPVENNGVSINHQRYFPIPVIMLNNLFDITTFGFCPSNVSGVDNYILWEIYDRVIITDTDDPVNNYTFERMRFLETNDCSDFIYDMVKQMP